MVNFYSMDCGYIVRWLSDLVNTKESILPVCDKPYYTNNGISHKWEELENLRNYALSSTLTIYYLSLVSKQRIRGQLVNI